MQTPTSVELRDTLESLNRHYYYIRSILPLTSLLIFALLTIGALPRLMQGKQEESPSTPLGEGAGMIADQLGQFWQMCSVLVFLVSIFIVLFFTSRLVKGVLKVGYFELDTRPLRSTVCVAFDSLMATSGTITLDDGSVVDLSSKRKAALISNLTELKDGGVVEFSQEDVLILIYIFSEKVALLELKEEEDLLNSAVSDFSK